MTVTAKPDSARPVLEGRASNSGEEPVTPWKSKLGKLATIYRTLQEAIYFDPSP